MKRYESEMDDQIKQEEHGNNGVSKLSPAKIFDAINKVINSGG